MSQRLDPPSGFDREKRASLGMPPVCQLWRTDEPRSTPRRAAQSGGTNKQTNLVTVCRSCHAGAHEETSTTRNREPENERWLPTVEEVSRLVRTTQHPLKRAIIGLFAKTGIGVGELCNLCMANIFLDDRGVSESYDIWEFDWVKSGHPALRIRVKGRGRTLLVAEGACRNHSHFAR